MAKTQQQIVDEANIAGQKASEVTGIDFTEGTVDTYFPRAVDEPTEPLPSTNNVGLPPVEPIETETTEEIQARKTKMAQGEIDALNKVYQDKIADQRVVNEGENRRTSSINTLTGLSGSTEAGVQAKKTEDLGNKEIEAINNQKALQMAQIFTKISESSIEEARYQREEARLDTQTAQANRLARIDEARADLSLLGAGTTATLEGLRNSMTPEQYEGMITNVGGEAMANAILFESRPKAQIGEIKEMDNGIIQITQMPDGTVKTEFTSWEDLGIDNTGVKSVQKLDNGQVMIIKDDGTYDTVGEAVSKKLSVTEAQKLNVPFGTTEEQAYGLTPVKDPSASGVSNTVIRQIDTLSKGFDSSPIVKQFNEVLNKSQSISAIVDGGISGPGDLALVFEFMKSLDPTSVVRESEYDVASKSGNPFKQLAEKMGGYVSSGQFIPQEVRDEFDRLSKLKLGVITNQYDNLSKETARKINIKTGAEDGADYLTDYKGALMQGGDQYADFRSQIGEGEILIERDGQVGAISESEFNPQTDKKL